MQGCVSVLTAQSIRNVASVLGRAFHTRVTHAPLYSNWVSAGHLLVVAWYTLRGMQEEHPSFHAVLQCSESSSVCTTCEAEHAPTPQPSTLPTKDLGVRRVDVQVAGGRGVERERGERRDLQE